MVPTAQPPKEGYADLAAGTIIDTTTGQAITQEALLSEISSVRVVFVGEQHTAAGHHDVQLKILKFLQAKQPNLLVGMEMFDRTYQTVLDRWSAGELTMEEFIRLTHWQANWKYPISLYREILEFVRDRHLRLIALNLAFHLPPKIAAGGIDSLSAEEKRLLPAHMDFQNAAHREYVKQIFEMHPAPVQENFDYFYEAQCVWDETMAETISQHLPEAAAMVVFLGNGHIFRHFGVPGRVFSRTNASFKTIYPVTAHGKMPDEDAADYLWITESDTPKK